MKLSDEALWASSRRRWNLRQWWRDRRLLLLAALLIILYLLATYLDERDRRREAQVEAYYMALTLSKTSCYGNEAPTSLLIAGDNREAIYKALMGAEAQARDVRLGWLIAKGLADGKRKGTY